MTTTEDLIQSTLARRPGKTEFVDDPNMGSYYCCTYHGVNTLSYVFWYSQDSWNMLCRGLIVRNVSSGDPFGYYNQNEEWVRC